MTKSEKQSLLVMLDYDGTLAPIAARPELARLTDARKRVLARLVRAPGVTVAVVTGRSLSDIESLLGVPGLVISANHGFEMSRSGKVFFPCGGGFRRHFKGLARDLQSALDGVQGALVECKGFSVAVHYRLVSRKRWGEVERAVRRVSLPCRKRFGWKVTGGKRVWEVRPAGRWNKGDAVLWIWNRFAPGSFPIYIGDDETDEDAFAALRKKGLTVLVGRRGRSAAACRMADVGKVWRMLKLMIEGVAYAGVKRR